MTTTKFGYNARPGANHHWPDDSDHQHWVFTFDNNRGAEVASDRGEPDLWWLQPLVDGSPDPRHDGSRGHDDEDVANLLDKIRRWEPYAGPEPKVPDDV